MSNTVAPRAFGRRLRVVGAMLAGALTVAALVPASAATAAGGAALLCDQNTVYGTDSAGALKRIDVNTGAVTDEATLSAPNAAGATVKGSNALAVVENGVEAFAVQESGASILRYDPTGGTVTTVGVAPASSGQTVIRGAYDPANHVFYTATNGTTATVGAYDVRSRQEIGAVGTISGLAGNSGDFAFSTSGVLFVVAGDEVRRVDQSSMPTTAGSAALTSTLLTTLPSGTSSPGIAFSSDGYLYAASSAGQTANAKLYKLDPASGRLIQTITLSNTSFIPRDLASCNYANTATGVTTVAERVQPGDQFTVAVTGGDITGAGSANSATTSGTASSATAGPVLALATTQYTVTQTAAGTTRPADYTTTWVCRRQSDPNGPPLRQGVDGVADFTMPSSGSDHTGTDVTCTFTNTPKTAGLRITSALGGPRIAAADQFVVAVLDRNGALVSSPANDTTTGSGAAVTGGSGDSGAGRVVVSRPYRLTQAAASGSASAYGQYAKTVTCTDSTGTQTGLPVDADFTGSVTVTPVPGSDITCTVTATAAPSSIAVATALGDPRFADADQFTPAIRDGSGTIVGTSATTTGNGSTVTAGTGTAVLDPATSGSTYSLTHTATADAGRYARTVSCADANGYQQGLPTGAAFTDGMTITPVPGARISCTVGVVLRGSGLRVNTAITDPRFADTDQFTAAIHRGDAAGAVVNSGGTPTTTGTGATVDPGTGTTGRVVTQRGAGYTITDDVSANAPRYAQTLTCTDLNGLQHPLPDGVPFTGAFAITPEPGADLVCTVAAAAKHPVLAVTAQLGSERFAAGDQFTTGLRDAGGTDLGAAGSGTTTGSGSTVDPGTGTTGATAVDPDAAYTLLGSPVANAARYDRTVTCTDAAGLQGGLPNSAAFSGSLSLTPQAGTAITCVVTTAMKAAALTATAALSASRLDDADQWTVAWRTGGASGTVLGGTAGATTTGTGSTVTAGTGVTGPIVAANGVAYTLTDAPSGHAARYATLLSCTDARGLQSGLPQRAAFVDSATITPEAGSDVRCVLTTGPAPAALALHLTGPAAAQVGLAGTWTADLTNGGGAAATGAVTFALPAGLDYTAVHGAGWSCTPGTAGGAATVACVGPSVAGGASGSLTLDLTPAAGSEGAAVLRGAVDPAGGGGTTAPAACTGTDAPVAGCAAARTVVGSTPHLVLGIASPASAAVGASATWRLTVSNDGTGAAGAATVAVRLPDGITAPVFSGASCTVGGQDAVCTVPGLIAAGAATAFTLTGAPAPGAAGAAPVVRGRLDPAGSTTTGDPAACSTTDAATGCAVSAPVAVGTGVALRVSVTPPTQLTEGVPAGYTVAVADTGTGPAAAPTVAVHLPDGLTYRGAAGADCTATGGDLTCTLPGAVPAGGSSGFVVTVLPVTGSAGTAVAPAAAVDPAGASAPRSAAGCTATPVPAGCAVADARVIGRVAAPAPATTGAPVPAQGRLLLVGTVAPVAPAGAQLVAGDRVRYAFTVTNRTGVALDRVAVTVPGLGQADCRAASLAAGATTTCALGPVTITQAQVDAGTASRDATAAGTPGGCAATCPAVTSNTVTLAAPVDALARIAAVQTVQLHDRNGDGVAQLGERVTFQVRVTNTGTVTLRGVRLADETIALACPSSTLAVGASMTCTGDRVTTAQDVAAGGIRNVAVASARGVAQLGTVTSQRTVGTVQAAGRTVRLPHTGSNLTAGVLAGAVLLAFGGVLLVGTRRRRRTS